MNLRFHELVGRHYRAISLTAIGFIFYLLYTSGLSHNPPGFFLDESGFAYNAYLIARTRAGEFGGHWPLFFQFYDGPFVQYGNPVYIYSLAIFFFLFKPGILMARVFSATIVFVATILLGHLAARISHRISVGIIVAVTAILTPWLFETSRLVMESSIYPLVLVSYLIVVHRASQKKRWTLVEQIPLALGLALLTYSYTIGRLLGPALGLGLFIFASSKQRLLGVIKVLTMYALTLIPLLIFHLRNPGALTDRFYSVTYIQPGMTRGVVFQFAKRYLQDLNPISLLFDGDANWRHHIAHALGSFLIGAFVLTVMGVALIIANRGRDPWWRYILFGTFVSVLPGALTVEFQTQRLIAYPIFLLVFAIPALEWLIEPLDQSQRAAKAKHTFAVRPNLIAPKIVSLTIILLLTVAQAVYFQRQFRTEGPQRRGVFDTQYKDVFDTAIAQPDRPIYLVDGTGPSYIHALWYAAIEGRDRSEFVHLEVGRRPPSGSLVISSEVECAECQLLMKRTPFMLYRVP